MSDAFKNAVLAPTPAPYDPNASHTLAEKIAHVAELAFEAVVETAKDVLHIGDTDWKGEGYSPVEFIEGDEPVADEEPTTGVAVTTPIVKPELLTHLGESDKANPETDEVMAKAVAAIATPDTETKTPDSAN